MKEELEEELASSEQQRQDLKTDLENSN